MAIIITGASSGIGHAIASYILANSNENVFLTARTEAPLAQFAEQYKSKVAYLVGDIGQEQTVVDIVEQTVAKFKTISGIIANAGVLEPVVGVDSVDIRKWKHHFDINYFSVVQLVSLSLKYLKQTKGNVIFVSSGASVRSTIGWAAYGDSKAAINHFALCVAHEVPEVRTLALAPGTVDTAMQTSIRGELGEKMAANELKRFVELKQTDGLLKPEFVAKIYGNLIIKGIPTSVNGEYVRYNDKRLKEYSGEP